MMSSAPITARKTRICTIATTRHIPVRWQLFFDNRRMPVVAESALRVPYSRIRELAEIAMRMDGVLRLYFGESNLPTPEYIKRAAQKAMAEGFTFYTENAGLPSLRKALARYYLELHSVELDPATEIVVTA